jgi:hypothetical protein
MKRNVIAAVLGAAGLIGLAASSYGQGQIFFNTYASTGYFPVTYSTAAQTALGVGLGAGPNVDAELGYFVGTSSNPAQFTLLPSTITAVGTSVAPINGTGASVAGYIQSGLVAGGIPGVTTAGAPVSFEILAWVASGAGSGTGPSAGTYGGTGVYSGSFIWTDTFSSANIGSSAPAGFFQQLTGNAVLSVPEPTTLALAGLGGLASLVAFRRKKA